MPTPCHRCDAAPDEVFRRGLCRRCYLDDRLNLVLDDGTGTAPPHLRAFVEGVTATPTPESVITWVSLAKTQRMLRALAQLPAPLDHEAVTGLDAVAHWKAVAFLRDLLIKHGCLPPADRNLLLFERWLAEQLARLDHDEHRKLLIRFTGWHVRRRLRALAEAGPVTPKQIDRARQQTKATIAFLAWLHSRGKKPDDCGQADVDEWFTEEFYTRRHVTAFLKWAVKTRLIGPVKVPHRRVPNPRPMAQQERLDVLRRIVVEPDIHPIARVTTMLMALYAQPLTRILRLTVDDVDRRDGEVTIRLGNPPTPVPEPFAAILLHLLDNRRNLTTHSTGARWLFPSVNPDQPMTAAGVRKHLRRHGLPALSGRSAALHQLLLEAPTPVVAGMLGFTDHHLAEVAQLAGITWDRYAASDHKRL